MPHRVDVDRPDRLRDVAGPVPVDRPRASLTQRWRGCDVERIASIDYAT